MFEAGSNCPDEVLIDFRPVLGNKDAFSLWLNMWRIFPLGRHPGPRSSSPPGLWWCRPASGNHRKLPKGRLGSGQSVCASNNDGYFW